MEIWEKAETYVEWGVEYLWAGQYKNAIENFDRAISINPDCSDAWRGRGYVFADLEDHEEAIACFDQAIQIDPDDVKSLHNRGISLSNIGSRISLVLSRHFFE